ncbi:thiamine-phosphate kinase [Luteolibacter sp. SL250]|uniref:thiamine-phosphate kinase n=1 Tax=Luteolibacter sp. SL250 TaxID=2995170 RepID=UPI00226F15B1|nr:thiamine-phosphate kinase [Luteolibacter sp. SL250]WAC20050.1 thiamine-phosphate kinase [Luteolibacter sp. SL250]
MKQLRDIGEDALIARLVKLVPHAPDASGPGDDCAVIDPGPHADTLQLLKTDALVERVHFLPDAAPRAVGWKAVARVVSDFAAMGGEPEHFLITLALPKSTPVEWIEEVYRGMGDCLARFGGLLAGGETSSVPDGSAAVISVAATGRVSRQHLVLRSTARTGDAVIVTGRLGGSLAGKHLDFIPRVREAAWLVRHFRPSAMMDLSDGLGKDLPRLAAASGCSFRIDESVLPVSPDCTKDQAIGDGEDFELLFTFPSGQVKDLLARWSVEFPDLPLTIIGEMAPGGEGAPLKGGWDHFRG